MHVLHLMVISAHDAEEAYHWAEKILNENLSNGFDYFTIEGSIDQNNKLDFTEKCSDTKIRGVSTIKEINSKVIGWIKHELNDSDTPVKLMQNFINNTKIQGTDWYIIEQFAKFQQELNTLKFVIEDAPNSIKLLKKLKSEKKSFIDEFDVLNHSFFEYDFCKCGVTNLGKISEHPSTKKFVVFVDCHH